jgi:hypothetical protein
VKRGVSETFDEHEQDTARRAYPKEVVDSAKRTTEIAKFDLARALQTESGTRPAVSKDGLERRARELQMQREMREAIDRHVRENIDVAFSPVRGDASSDEDPHSRPTIEAGVFHALVPVRETESSGRASMTQPLAEATALRSETPPTEARVSAVNSIAPSAPRAVAEAVAPLPRRWTIALALFVVLLVSAAGAAGFVFGRRSVHR